MTPKKRAYYIAEPYMTVKLEAIYFSDVFFTQTTVASFCN